MALRRRRNLEGEVSTEGAEVATEVDASQETFAESQGLPANKHAKELAKAEAKAKKVPTPKGVFYSLKAGNKVVKHIVKPHGLYQDYIGNLSRHRDGLEPKIKQWKAEGVWAEPHEVAAKVAALRADLGKK